MLLRGLSQVDHRQKRNNEKEFFSKSPPTQPLILAWARVPTSAPHHHTFTIYQTAKFNIAPHGRGRVFQFQPPTPIDKSATVQYHSADRRVSLGTAQSDEPHWVTIPQRRRPSCNRGAVAAHNLSWLSFSETWICVLVSCDRYTTISRSCGQRTSASVASTSTSAASAHHQRKRVQQKIYKTPHVQKHSAPGTHGCVMK